MNYQLNIAIDQPGLNAIYGAGQSVTIVQAVNSSPLSTGNLPVAWLAFQPWLSNNISWTTNYYIYASNTSMQSGAVLNLMAQTSTPVQPGWLYTLQQGSFTGSSGTGSTFNAENQQQTGTITQFGLAQYANVNGVSTFSPLNATPVLFNQEASFTPIVTLSVFLSSYSNNGVVISQVASNACVLQLTSQDPVGNIGFNDSTNEFYLIGTTAAARSLAETVGADIRRSSAPARTGRGR
jgi:hypothetical protein